MKKNIIVVLTAIALVVAGTGTVSAQGVPWSDHAPPFSFLFENHIDMHQQSKTLENGGLQGFFYIHFTTETFNGTPVAVHGQDSVGWLIDATPASARLVSKSPLTWCVDPGQIPKAPGYTHFHWVGPPEMGADLVEGETYEGYLLKLTATTTFYFRHEDSNNLVLVTPGIDYASHQNVIVGCP